MKPIIFFLLMCFTLNCTAQSGYTPFYDTEAKLWGYKNAKGKVVIDAQYSIADEFSEGLAYVAILNNTYMEQTGNNVVGYIDKHNQFQVRLKEALANLPNGCYFHGKPFQSGKAKMTIFENDGDCVNRGWLIVDSKGIIIEHNWQ